MGFVKLPHTGSSLKITLVSKKKEVINKGVGNGRQQFWKNLIAQSIQSLFWRQLLESCSSLFDEAVLKEELKSSIEVGLEGESADGRPVKESDEPWSQ